MGTVLSMAPIEARTAADVAVDAIRVNLISFITSDLLLESFIWTLIVAVPIGPFRDTKIWFGNEVAHSWVGELTYIFFLVIVE